jgi:DNA primase
MKNILDLFEDLTRINNSEWAGPCPKCGGSDRFRVWPEKARFWCRQCGIRGDAIDGYRLIHDCGFLEAKRALGIETDNPLPGRPTRKPRPKCFRELSDPPNQKWRDTVGSLHRWAENSLSAYSDWLLDARGIEMQTARLFRLAWNPTTRHVDPTVFGFSSSERHVFVSEGLLIPRFSKREIVCVRIRRSDPGEGPRYWMVRGSQAAWNVFGRSTPSVIVVESELCAILLHQQTGLRCFASTSASLLPDEKQAQELKRSLVVDCLDNDSAGQGLSNKLAAFLPNYVRAVPPSGKDPTDCWRAGLDLKSWIQSIAGGALESQTA